MSDLIAAAERIAQLEALLREVVSGTQKVNSDLRERITTALKEG